MKTERPLNISVTLSMAISAKAHVAEGQFRRLKATLSKQFRFGTRRPTVSKRVGQHLKPLQTSVKKGHPGNAFEHSEVCNFK
jgi:hypothetical protein